MHVWLQGSVSQPKGCLALKGALLGCSLVLLHMHSLGISPASDEQHAADEDVTSVKEQSELCGPLMGFTHCSHHILNCCTPLISCWQEGPACHLL